nr:hypothetical protein CFP56_22046 [Quercus suber]
MKRLVELLGENSKYEPFPHAAVLFFSSAMANKDWAGQIEHIRQGTPRAVLLMGLAMVFAAPFALLWTAALLSLCQQRKYRSWLLGGALVGSLSFIGLCVALGGDVRRIKVSQICDCALLGLSLGAATCSLLSIKGRQSTQANIGEEHEAAVPTEPSEEQEIAISTTPGAKEIPSAGKLETTEPATLTAEETDNYLLTLVIIIVSTWLAHLECQKLAAYGLHDFWTVARANKVVMGGLVFERLCMLFLYGLAARWYLRTSSHLAWEGLCGLLGGLAGLATLRLSTSDMSPQSWTVDSALAFVAANVSLGVGVLTRDRLVTRRF